VSAPPGLPADRLQALRRAFDLTMKDPDFLAFAKKRHMPIEPMTGDELHRLIEQGVNTPQSVVQRMNKLVGGF
jgi:tripartite-type tricarboxylate transporter receptor subunit TctC